MRNTPPLQGHELHDILGPARHWDGKNVTYSLRRVESTWEYPHWYRVSCGCCNGIQWGGLEPVECDECGGTYHFWVHESGAVAMYPGGPFTGFLLRRGGRVLCSKKERRRVA